MLRAGTVYLVGAGPGDPGLITRRGLAVLRDADVVVYDRLTSPELLLEARTDARVHYVGKSSSHHALSQTEINRLLVEEAKAGRSVCRLKGGDPFLFGRGGEEADHLVEQGVSFEVVPGVTSAVAVPAYAGIPVTDRRAASSLAIVTGQEEGEREGTRVDWQRLARAADTLVVLMGVKNLKEITRELLSGGREAITPSALIRWGTTGQQQTIVSTLAQIAAEAERRAFAAPAILVVGEVVTMARRLNWFEPRPLRGLRVLVARPRQQASALADLLRAAGAEPVVCSLIRTEPVAVDAARLQALCEQTWGWVLFTSANGVSHFGKLIQQAGLDWRCLAGARIGAMGPGTAAELRQRELVVDFVPSRSVAESLAAELPEVSAGTRILLARAEEAREVLPRLLRERGAAVEVLTVYRTLPDEEGSRSLATALEAGEVDVITLTSASTVRQLTRLASTGTLARYTIASIGPITSQAAREAGLQVDIEAQEHTIPGLVAALAAYSAERKKQA